MISRLGGVAAGVATLLVACGSPAYGAPSLPGAGTADVSRAPTGDIAHLADVRLTPESGFDRLVLTFTDRIPGYTIGYRALPAYADASGFEIPLPGAADMVQIALNPATGAGWAGGERTYLGPPTVSAATAAVTDAKAAGDFEAVLTWVVGLRAKVPFRVVELDTPPRLEVDFQAP